MTRKVITHQLPAGAGRPALPPNIKFAGSGEKLTSEYKEVPISAARQIAEEFDKDQVIIVTWDEAHQMQHVTTYGRSRKSSAQAAQSGNFVKEALGWPDRLCHDAPGWWLTNIEKIGKLADEADNYIAAAGLPMPAPFHLEQLKSGLRSMSARLKEIYVAVVGHDPWPTRDKAEDRDG